MMTPVIANAGIPMLFFHLPAMVLALAPVVFAEWLVSRRYRELRGRRTAVGVFAANVFSLILGFPTLCLVALGVLAITGPGLSKALEGTHLIVQHIFSFPAEMIWLGSDVGSGKVITRGLAMLVPAFFLSVYSERFLLKLMWRDIDFATTKQFSWVAHAISYPVLVAVWIGYATYFFRQS